jgi:hypothetical protein
MVPRADIEAVDQTITIGELMILFEESGRSRMPVYARRWMTRAAWCISAICSPMSPSRRATSAAQRQQVNGECNDRRGFGRRSLENAQAKPSFDLGRVDLQKTVAEAGIIRKILFVPPSMLPRT